MRPWAWLLVLVACLASGGPPPRANAQAGKKPEERGLRSLVEIGPPQELKGGAVPGAAWGVRTTEASGATSYTVRVSADGKAYVFSAEDMASFARLAAAVETKRKGRKKAPGAHTELVRWTIIDADAKARTFVCDLSKGTWAVEGAGYENVPDAIERALKDIGTIKKSKPVLPW